MKVNELNPNIGPRIAVYEPNGRRLAKIGHLGYGFGIGQFAAPHSLCTDSRNDIYVGEVAWTNANNHNEAFDGIRSFQKLSKIE